MSGYSPVHLLAADVIAICFGDSITEGASGASVPVHVQQILSMAGNPGAGRATAYRN